MKSRWDRLNHGSSNVCVAWLSLAPSVSASANYRLLSFLLLGLVERVRVNAYPEGAPPVRKMATRSLDDEF